MQRTPEEYVKATGKSLSWTEGSVRYTASPISASGVSVSELSAQSGPSYAAETYCVVDTGETGWCVKRGDDLVCDVYAHQGEEMARRITTLLNTQPAGARDAVTDEMVERAADAAWFGYYFNETDRQEKYAAARKIIEAALAGKADSSQEDCSHG